MKLPKSVWTAMLVIVLMICICSVLSRTLTSSQTLADYAAANPEIAYQTTEEDSSESEESTESTTEDTTSTTEESTTDENATDTEDNERTPDDMDFIDEYADTDKRYTLADGFYYEPIPVAIQERITGISYPEEGALVSLDELSYLRVKHYDFYGEVQTGELICNVAIAEDLAEIFYDLYKAEYQIEKIKLIDSYQADDHLSMLDNNTSCFNYRVVDNTTRLSKHAYGLAIDMNPYYNPYVTYVDGATHVSPEGSEPYADRTASFPYKIDENDLCYKLFIAHGFSWGGNWNSSKDYQHFQKNIE